MSRWIPSRQHRPLGEPRPRPRLDHRLLGRPAGRQVPRRRRTLVGGVAALTGGERLGEHRSRLVDLLGEIRNGNQVDPNSDYAHAPNASRHRVSTDAHRTYEPSSPQPRAGSSSIAASCRFSGASWSNRRSAGRSYIGWPAGDRRRQPALTGQHPRVGPLAGSPRAAPDPAPPGTPAGAPARPDPTRGRSPRLVTRPALSGNFSPSRSVSRTHTKCAAVGQLVVDAVQAAVRRDDAVAQDLAQAHHLEDRRAALGVPGQALLADDEQRRTRRNGPASRRAARAARSRWDRWPASRCRAWRSPRCRRRPHPAWPATGPARESLPPRPAPSAPRPGAGIEVCTPSPKLLRVGHHRQHRQAHLERPGRRGPAGWCRRPGPRRSPAGAGRWRGRTSSR